MPLKFCNSKASCFIKVPCKKKHNKVENIVRNSVDRVHSCSIFILFKSNQIIYFPAVNNTLNICKTTAGGELL